MPEISEKKLEQLTRMNRVNLLFCVEMAKLANEFDLTPLEAISILSGHIHRMTTKIPEQGETLK